MSGYIKSIRTVREVPHSAESGKGRACQSERLWSKKAMIASYLNAKLSGRLSASAPVVKERLASCRGCPSYCTDGQKAWCGACGCGSKREEAMIEGGKGPSKLTFVRLHCPRKKPGFTNHE